MQAKVIQGDRVNIDGNYLGGALWSTEQTDIDSIADLTFQHRANVLGPFIGKTISAIAELILW